MALGQWGQQHRGLILYTLGVLLGMSVVLSVFSRLRTNRRVAAHTTHGSARWATPKEIRQAGLYGNGGVVLGTAQGRVLRDTGPGHVLLCGPTRSGKDVGTNFPTTLTWPGSLIVTDVKGGGENYTVCAGWRATMSKVYRFAPTMRRSANLNVLDSVRVGKPEEFRDVSVIVGSMLAPLRQDGHDSETSRFFRHHGRTLLRATTLYVLQALPRKSFGGVLEFMSRHVECLKAMRASRHPTIHQTATMVSQMADRQLSGVWDTAMNALDIYRDPLIAHHTERSDFCLTDLQFGAQPVTLYLVANAPTELLHLHPIFRAILQQTLAQLMEHPGKNRRRLLWLLNELPAFGYMDLFEQALAVAAGYDMKFLVTIQDLGQLWSVYGAHTPLWGNTATKVFHGPANDQTAKRLSEMLGPTTVEYASEHHTQGVFGKHARSSNMQRSARPLLNEAELLGLDTTQEIVWSPGCPHPILAQKVRYYADPQLQTRAHKAIP